ncbi:hypothetical protein HDU96_006268 [Phlyctochytrium bullatum]|nr:hypothetical protein HDU96_006268 [Phlyctochytrium bullatum]
MFGLFSSSPSFTANDIPDLKGKTIVVTGATSGIGEASVFALAAKNAEVVLAVRSREKAENTVKAVKEQTPDANLVIMELDLSDLSSVKRFADEYKASKKPLHVLLNNAGILAPPEWTPSKDGIELQWASNTVGPMYLTMSLLSVIEDTANKAGEARIVNVSSDAHPMTYSGGINFETLTTSTGYGPWYSYGQSKLGNILFTRELAKRLEARSVKNVYVNTLHPGVIKTNIQKGAASFPQFLIPYLGYLGFTTPENGARTQLYASTSPEIVEKGYKGVYFVPYGKVTKTSALAEDEGLMKRFWEWCEGTLKEKGFTF